MIKGEFDMNEKKLTINGEEVTWNKLFKESGEIISVKDLINTNRDLIDMLNHMFSAGDDFGVKYFIQSGGLERLELSLEYITKRLEIISNNICPDEQAEGFK